MLIGRNQSAVSTLIGLALCLVPTATPAPLSTGPMTASLSTISMATLLATPCSAMGIKTNFGDIYICGCGVRLDSEFQACPGTNTAALPPTRGLIRKILGE